MHSLYALRTFQFTYFHTQDVCMDCNDEMDEPSIDGEWLCDACIVRIFIVWQIVTQCIQVNREEDSKSPFRSQVRLNFVKNTYERGTYQKVRPFNTVKLRDVNVLMCLESVRIQIPQTVRGIFTGFYTIAKYNNSVRLAPVATYWRPHVDNLIFQQKVDGNY